VNRAPGLPPAGDREPPLLATTGLGKRYRRPGGGVVTALQEVDFEVRSGRSVGVVGETGSGKSTLLRLLLRLEPATSGEIRFRGVPTTRLQKEGMRSFRRDVQAVFQDPRSSLDPRERVWRLVTEPAEVGHGFSGVEQRRLAAELLELVDLGADRLERRPGSLSGGECQRVAIARALSARPAVVLLDEPVTSLDVSLRGLVLNLLRRLSAQRSCTYVVVSHDITAICYLAAYVYVLLRGLVVEEGPTAEVVSNPLHPYTRLLVEAAGSARAAAGDQVLREGAPGRCPFLSRCPVAVDACRRSMPVLATRAERRVRCHHWPA
jgi:oligopeptide/dipeptide ABC transporter ATP-binding protein